MVPPRTVEVQPPRGEVESHGRRPVRAHCRLDCRQQLGARPSLARGGVPWCGARGALHSAAPGKRPCRSAAASSRGRRETRCVCRLPASPGGHLRSPGPSRGGLSNGHAGASGWLSSGTAPRPRAGARRFCCRRRTGRGAHGAVYTLGRGVVASAGTDLVPLAQFIDCRLHAGLKEAIVTAIGGAESGAENGAAAGHTTPCVMHRGQLDAASGQVPRPRRPGRPRRPSRRPPWDAGRHRVRCCHNVGWCGVRARRCCTHGQGGRRPATRTSCASRPLRALAQSLCAREMARSGTRCVRRAPAACGAMCALTDGARIAGRERLVRCRVQRGTWTGRPRQLPPAAVQPTSQPAAPPAHCLRPGRVRRPKPLAVSRHQAASIWCVLLFVWQSVSACTEGRGCWVSRFERVGFRVLALRVEGLGLRVWGPGFDNAVCWCACASWLFVFCGLLVRICGIGTPLQQLVVRPDKQIPGIAP